MYGAVCRIIAHVSRLVLAGAAATSYFWAKLQDMDIRISAYEPAVGFLLVAVTALVAGCSDTYMEIGNNWTDVNSRVIVIDTCSVNLSSVKLDSISTSGGGALYAGIRKSEYWGTTDLSTYLSFKMTEDFEDNSTPEYSERIIFDSLTLYLMPDKTFCGDTMQSMNLMAYRLEEELMLNDDDVLYAHSSFPYSPQPVGSKSFMPRPLRGRAVEIRLSDELGTELLDKVIAGDADMEDDDSFRKWFKGLLLKAGEPCGSIMGFSAADTLCRLRLYYRSQDYAEPVEHVLNFDVDSTCMFTHVDADFSGTPLASLSEKNEEVSSIASENKAFASGMLGIYTKIGFPYLNNLRSLGTYCKADRAELIVYPLPGSYARANYSPLPDELNLYVSDENNISTGGAITDSNGQTLQTGSLTYDEMMFPESTFYTYDITDFINDQFGKIGVNRNFLQMIDPDYGYTLEELVTDDRYSGSGYEVKMIIRLAIYDE